MTIRELLRKKSTINRNGSAVTAQNVPKSPSQEVKAPNADSHHRPIEVPEFTFLRTTTLTEEVITVPSYPGDDEHDDDDHALPSPGPGSKPSKGSPLRQRRRSFFRTKSDDRHGKIPESPIKSPAGSPVKAESDHDLQLPSRPAAQRTFSDRLRAVSLSKKSSHESVSSPTLPDDLDAAPESISTPVSPAVRPDRQATDNMFAAATRDLQQSREAQWERRATRLALDGHLPSTKSATPASSPSSPFKPGSLIDKIRPSPEKPSPAAQRATSKSDDEATLQRAITLHESGDFESSTTLFASLADENGPNNPLAQVLYGLSLRHGWGCDIDLPRALHFLSLAARTSAAIEASALQRGSKTGGAAKGELVIAIFELANCFRHGWGIKADEVAARTYYETAANLGDLDAMEEVATCLVNGTGGPKDKVSILFDF